MLFGKKKSVAGLDVGSSSIKVVELDGKVSSLNLVSLGFENLPDDTVVDGQIMELNAVSEVIQNVCSDHKIKANQVVTGVIVFMSDVIIETDVGKVVGDVFLGMPVD